jgi:uncharacterized protein with NAD-binding domain and iron-sulfur cluster
LGKERIFDVILAEIRALLPAARHATIVRSRVVTERSATFSIQPGLDRYRPGPATRIPNLWLAGDYTNTGWPATMEGAVRSGYLAAEAILATLGRPTAALQPPLPTARFTRWLMG